LELIHRQDAFSLYHQVQQAPEKTAAILGGPALPALGHAIAGSTGSAISNITVFPLDLIITRLQVQRQLRKVSSSPDEGEYQGLKDAVAKIYSREGGLPAFYTGVVQDTGKSILDSFLFFLAYNFLRQRRLQSRDGSKKSLPVLDELGAGVVAGAFSKFITTPIANIVTRKQTASMLSARSSGSAKEEPSVADIAEQIKAERGLQGFWSGYSASLVLTLNPSITFFLFEFFKRSLIPRSRRENPGASMTFLLAAISKAIASTITYPFSLAKACAQISSRSSESKDEEATSTGPQSSKPAPLSTLASIILIYRTEGLSALYEGLSGEVLKGFFSHGITMIVKDAVHQFIIQTYYLLLKLLRRYPSPAELAKQAANSASQSIGSIRDGAGQILEKSEEVLADGVDIIRERTSQGIADINTLASESRIDPSSSAELASSPVNKSKQSILETGKAAAALVGRKTE
jgi:hypothetical protein